MLEIKVIKVIKVMTMYKGSKLLDILKLINYLSKWQKVIKKVIYLKSIFVVIINITFFITFYFSKGNLNIKKSCLLIGTYRATLPKLPLLPFFSTYMPREFFCEYKIWE